MTPKEYKLLTKTLSRLKDERLDIRRAYDKGRIPERALEAFKEAFLAIPPEFVEILFLRDAPGEFFLHDLRRRGGRCSFVEYEVARRFFIMAFEYLVQEHLGEVHEEDYRQAAQVWAFQSREMLF